MEVAVFYLSKGRSVIDPTDKPFQARDTNSGSPKTLLQAVLPGVLVSVDPWGQILYFSDDPAHAARADKISQRLRVRLETEAKLEIQRRIMTGELDLVWSYILDYESSASPIEERQQAIRVWKSAALVDVDEKPSILSRANAISKTGVASKDALHVACAISAGCAYFFTTDDHVIKRLKTLKEIKVANPVEFVVGETK
jgi:predicted nucleic acid-binding protein